MFGGSYGLESMAKGLGFRAELKAEGFRCRGLGFESRVGKWLGISNWLFEARGSGNCKRRVYAWRVRGT